MFGKIKLLLAPSLALITVLGSGGGKAFAIHVCGDAVCDATGPSPESCLSCPEDCGACPYNGITYHGGPLMLGSNLIYYIFYGNWSGNSAPTILTDLASSIGGSPYFNINTTYYNSTGTHVTNSVAYGSSTTDSYSQGTSLTAASIVAIVSSAITSQRLPKNTSGIYFVLTSADVSVQSFCTNYCGWHGHATISGSDIKYAFVGNPDRCPSTCELFVGNAPNGNAGADGMANLISHELAEAVTDPDISAWYEGSLYENADMCVWNFGTTYSTTNGSSANVHLGTRDYLLQQNWVNDAGGYCALNF